MIRKTVTTTVKPSCKLLSSKNLCLSFPSSSQFIKDSNWSALAWQNNLVKAANYFLVSLSCSYLKLLFRYKRCRFFWPEKLQVTFKKTNWISSFLVISSINHTRCKLNVKYTQHESYVCWIVGCSNLIWPNITATYPQAIKHFVQF